MAELPEWSQTRTAEIVASIQRGALAPAVPARRGHRRWDAPAVPQNRETLPVKGHGHDHRGTPQRPTVLKHKGVPIPLRRIHHPALRDTSAAVAHIVVQEGLFPENAGEGIRQKAVLRLEEFPIQRHMAGIQIVPPAVLV